ncbi:unnamed protein product, partial [Mesorhabditis spiculigera]
MTQAQMQMVAELEMEMMSDMYRRMTGACQEKCISRTFKEADLTKGESVSLFSASVDKTANFVTRNGVELENKIREKEAQNPRFFFLLPTDPYNAYYKHKVKELHEGKEEAPRIQVPEAVKEHVKKVAEAITRPPPAHEFSDDPTTINAFDLDLIRLTALFVARNGRSFMTNLMNREMRNFQFVFLKPQHSNFQYFSRLVEQYTKVLIPSNTITKELSEQREKKRLLDDVDKRVRWEKYQKSLKDKEEAELEKERVAYAQIDWHDFVLVQTVDFSAQDLGNLPPLCTPNDVGARILLEARKEQEKASESAAMDMEESEDEQEIARASCRACQRFCKQLYLNDASSYGTAINGVNYVKKSHPLNDGDTFIVGDHEFVVEILPEMKPPPNQQQAKITGFFAASQGTQRATQRNSIEVLGENTQRVPTPSQRPNYSLKTDERQRSCVASSAASTTSRAAPPAPKRIPSTSANAYYAKSAFFDDDDIISVPSSSTTQNRGGNGRLQARASALQTINNQKSTTSGEEGTQNAAPFAPTTRRGVPERIPSTSAELKRPEPASQSRLASSKSSAQQNETQSELLTSMIKEAPEEDELTVLPPAKRRCAEPRATRQSAMKPESQASNSSQASRRPPLSSSGKDNYQELHDKFSDLSGNSAVEGEEADSEERPQDDEMDSQVHNLEISRLDRPIVTQFSDLFRKSQPLQSHGGFSLNSLDTSKPNFKRFRKAQ